MPQSTVKLSTPKPIRLGNAQVAVPALTGAAGPNSLRPRHAKLNEPSDLALVDGYLRAIADLTPAQASNPPPGPVTGTRLLAVAGAVAHWKADRNGAIAAFLRTEGVGNAEEQRDNVLLPDGSAWKVLVTFGELARRLVAERNKPKGNDYVHHGGFRQQDFVAEATARFRTEALLAPRFTTVSFAGMLDLLDRISRDPGIIDIRWAAYMLATALWETAVPVTLPAANPKGKPRRVMQWGSPSEEIGKGWLNKNDVKDYYLKVKVRKLPDGSAEVTEQDGNIFSVDKSGRITTRPQPPVGAKYQPVPTSIYAQAAGAELAYYGRGYVHLTWWNNYATDGAAIGLGLELLFNPDKALQPDIAYKIMSNGMVYGRGFANNHRLQQYFCGAYTDYVGARMMVNGRDHAADIARAARIFEASLMASRV